MNALCEKLDLFVDGELSKDECEHVRVHLGRCGTCAVRFQDAVQLQVLATEAFGDVRASGPAPARKLSLVEEPPAPVVSEQPPVQEARRGSSPQGARPHLQLRHRVAWGLALAAAFAAVVYVSLPTNGASGQLWLTDAPTRRLEARLSFNPLDKHRPFVPMRSGDSSAVEPVPLGELSRLDEEKDANAIAAAFLIRGDAEQARGFLEAASPSPDRDNDLAVVEMQRGELHKALQLLDRVLQKAPGHSQALWNRALVLRDLGQKELAAQAFEQIAARGEPGWSAEASQDARSLRESQTP
jgi:hypothetical protein